MHYDESALTAKRSFETQSPTSSVGLQISAGKPKNCSESTITTQTNSGTFREKFRFGYFIFSSNRNVGTPYIVRRGTPEFSTKDPN